MKSIKEIFENKREKLFLVFKIIFTLAFVAYLLYYVKLKTIEQTFIKSDFSFLILGILLLPFDLLLLFKRWELLVNSLMGKAPKSKIASSLFHGFAGGLITPLRAGEYFIRKIPLPDFKLKDVMIGTFTDKMFLIPPQLLLGGIFLFFFLFKKEIISSTILFALLLIFPFILFLLFFVAYFLIKNSKSALVKKISNVKFLERMEYFIAKINFLNPRQITKLFLLSLFLYLTYSTQFALFIKSMSPTANFFDCLIISNSVLLLKNFLPLITMGELGVREAFSIYFVKQFNLPASVGFNAAFIIFVVNLLIPSLIGYIFILREKRW